MFAKNPICVASFFSRVSSRRRFLFISRGGEREKADQNRRLCFFFSNSPSSSFEWKKEERRKREKEKKRARSRPVLSVSVSVSVSSSSCAVLCNNNKNLCGDVFASENFFFLVPSSLFVTVRLLFQNFQF